MLAKKIAGESLRHSERMSPFSCPRPLLLLITPVLRGWQQIWKGRHDLATYPIQNKKATWTRSLYKPHPLHYSRTHLKKDISLMFRTLMDLIYLSQPSLQFIRLRPRHLNNTCRIITSSDQEIGKGAFYSRLQNMT